MFQKSEGCKLIFFSITDNRGQASMFQRSLSDANSKVDDMVKCYLISEEEAMQERIRFVYLSLVSLFE